MTSEQPHEDAWPPAMSQVPAAGSSVSSILPAELQARGTVSAAGGVDLPRLPSGDRQMLLSRSAVESRAAVGVARETQAVIEAIVQARSHPDEAWLLYRCKPSQVLDWDA